MPYILISLSLVLIALVIVCLVAKPKRRKKSRTKSHYDARGFDRNRLHKNGTKFDDFGFDYFGYDENGFNKYGYNKFGKNEKGQYDRYYDKTSVEEGFLSYRSYPIGLTTHAEERLRERLGYNDTTKMLMQAIKAYRYGKSKRQIKRSSAYMIEEIEQRHENGIVLIYKGYIYVFSSENALITVYKNDKIPL